MKVFVLVLVLPLLMSVSGCGLGKDTPAKASQSDDAVVIKLQGVLARQYSGSKMRFEFRMNSMILREQDGELDATGSIRGVLMEPLWKDKH